MKSRLTRTVIAGVALLALLGVLLTLPAGVKMTPSVLAGNSSSNVTGPPSDSAARMRISEAYGKLPLSFEQNQGQTDRKVKFLARGKGYTLLLTPAEAVLSLRSEQAADADSEKTQLEKREMQSAVLRMKLVGANASPKIEGRERLQGKSNYLIGNDRQKWRTDISNFARVHYSEVYPGIDLVYYGTNQRQLEYDFVLQPGADPRVIRLSFDGADELKLDADGQLRLKLKGGEITQPAPVIYQKTESGEKQQVAGHYVLKGEREVVFEVAEYDRSRELVIDPQLLYATFYGGSGDDSGNAIAVDGNGNAYVTGETSSIDLSIKSAFQGALPGGDRSAYIVKFNADGSDIVYATYLGGTNHPVEHSNAIALTSDGKACVTGLLGNDGSNSDFPTTSNRFQGNGSNFANNRGLDAFLTVLTPAGNGLFYSTFFGAGGVEEGFGIAVDAANKIYISGRSNADNLPTKNAFQNSQASTSPGTPDAFIAKFDPSQSGNSSLIYSSYLGGAGGEFGNDIAVTPAGVAFIVGVTGSFNFPTKSSSSLPPFQTSQGGVNDSFIAKVSPSGALIYSTYFGGNGRDEAQSVAVDSDERAYVTGFTESSATTFPLKNAFQPNRIGAPNDAFVAKFNADGTALFYSSFLASGNGINKGFGIAIDAGGNAYVTGLGVDFVPSLTVNGFPAGVPNGSGLVAKIEASDATGTTIPKILYRDGVAGLGAAIAVDQRGNVYIVGSSNGSFVPTPGAFQETFQGINDATIVKIGSTFPDTIGVFRPPATPRSIEFRLRNSNTAGSPDLNVDFGQTGDQALAGDWNGDGVDDVGVFRPSTAQFLLRQPTRLQTGVVINVTLTLNFGLTGDKAVVGDWNGDGIDTPGVFRSGQWLLTNGPNTNNTSPPIDLTFNFGQAGDLPVAGDWDGDGRDSIGTFQSDADWQLRNDLSAGAPDFAFNFGANAGGDLPVVGDWNGDGIDSIGVFRPSDTSFSLRNTNSNGPVDITALFGQSGDLPMAGDWDGKPSNTPPNSGINDPSEGASSVGQTQTFTTTCSDPDGWRDIRSIDFKIARTRSVDRDRDDLEDDRGRAKDDWRDKDENDKHDDEGAPLIFWVRFDENRNVIRFYDPDLQTWRESAPGANIVLESRFARLDLSGTSVQGSGPLGPSVQVTWKVVFKRAAKGSYKQFLKITDDTGSSTGFDRVGSWKVKH